MIDTHCHILPGIDDGCQTMAESLALARQMVEQGIEHALCTPHHKNGRYQSEAEVVIPAVISLQAELDRAEIGLRVYEGQEIRMNPDLLRDCEKHRLLGMDAAGRYLLVEFPQHEIPLYTEKLFERLRQQGCRPVIAHPERNQAFLKNPLLLEKFVQMGAVAQLTAPSYLGFFGKRTQKFAQTLVRHRLIHVVASDAHGVERRPCLLAAAYAQIALKEGVALVESLQANAKHIMNGEDVPQERTFCEWRKNLFGEWM